MAGRSSPQNVAIRDLMKLNFFRVNKAGWHWGILAGMIMAVYGLYPQYVIIAERGTEYNGVFASNDLDESAYAAYLQALIEGRPRKNDPYSGRDQTPESPQYESIFSIQFAAPYAVAIPAIIFGLNTAEAMIATSAVASFFTAISLFWLLVQITSDRRFAGIATLMILLGGALASGIGVISEFLGHGSAYPYLPFLRRYIPAIGFPFFFAVFGFLYLALKSEVRRVKYIAAVASGLAFSFTVFSYLYLWSTAAAFLFVFTVLWIVVRPENWKSNIRFLLLADCIAAASLVPHFWLVSMRAPDIDSIILLVVTHAPDLFRVPALVSYAALISIGIAIKLGYTRLKDVRTLFMLAFSLVPFIVFNQQVITGHSLQPFHFEFYVVNYITALVAVLSIFLYFRRIRSRRIYVGLLSILFLATLVWGFFEVKYTTRSLVFWNILRDEAVPVSNRLVELAKANESLGKKAVTLNYDYIQANNQTTLAPQAVLWARHQNVFAGVPWAESKQRFYKLIYYAGRDENWLREDIKGGDIEAYMALFGWDRFNARLSVNARPLTLPEIEEEVQRYKRFCADFSRAQASDPELSFAVVPADSDIDITNLSKWYEIGEVEHFGKYDLYRLSLRD